MNFDEAVAWLQGTESLGIQPGLERTRGLLAALEVPLGESDEGPRYLHVAGTNGKGSVCAMLASICQAAGFRTGLFTSPALLDLREQIRLDGQPISRPAMAAGLTRLREVAAEWDDPPTVFELTTALALAYFAQERADLVVLETGLGGRLDATNVVTPIVSVLTPIDLDHQQWLGLDPAAIAREKAGIIKPFVPAITSPQKPEVQRVLEQVVHAQGATLHVVASPLGPRRAVALIGAHQRWNAALAVHALSAAGLEVGEAAIATGLREVRWAGRFQTLGRFTLDGAHNPAAARALAHAWRETFPSSPPATLILGVLRDKDAAGICAALVPLAARVFTVAAPSSRTLEAVALAEIVRGAASVGIDVHSCADLEEAIQQAAAHAEPVLIAGSLFLVGAALRALGTVTV